MKRECESAALVPDRQLHILLAEDNPDDVDLCIRALKKAGLSFRYDLVSTLSAFVERLSAQHYDVVLADYNLGGWTGMDALDVVQKEHPDIPFLLLTGALGDERAVECLKHGVDDYILKDRIARLPSALGRALYDRALREKQRIADASVRENEERFRVLTESIASPVFIYQGTVCRYANRAAEEITGYTKDELLRTSSWEIIHPDSRDTLIDQGLARLQGSQDPLKFELKILTKHGVAKWLDITMQVIQFDGKPAGLFSGFDITDRKSAEEQIIRQVASDPLTGLGNARRLNDAFAAEEKRSSRTGRSFALMLLDLDNLKEVNDAYGHLTGSRALCRLANILRNQCRSGDVAARQGGDEFAIILPETGFEGAQLLARRISERLSNDGQQPTLSVSTGAAVYPTDGNTYEKLFTVADHALYSMKANVSKRSLAQ